MSREDRRPGEERRPPRPGRAVAAVGVDHVRLSYHYLDTGDLDAYGSLLDENALMSRPDGPTCHGRAEILECLAAWAASPSKHHIYKIIAADDAIAVTGRCTPRPGWNGGIGGAGADGTEVEFADIFTLTDEGLLLACRRYYFVAPPPPEPEVDGS